MRIASQNVMSWRAATSTESEKRGCRMMFLMLWFLSVVVVPRPVRAGLGLPVTGGLEVLQNFTFKVTEDSGVSLVAIRCSVFDSADHVIKVEVINRTLGLPSGD